MGWIFKDLSYNRPLDNWDIGEVTYLKGMFKDASEFNQCLSSWESKKKDDVIIKDIFKGSGCPEQRSPTNSDRPWCQNSTYGCVS